MEGKWRFSSPRLTTLEAFDMRCTLLGFGKFKCCWFCENTDWFLTKLSSCARGVPFLAVYRCSSILLSFCWYCVILRAMEGVFDYEMIWDFREATKFLATVAAPCSGDSLTFRLSFGAKDWIWSSFLLCLLLPIWPRLELLFSTLKVVFRS